MIETMWFTIATITRVYGDGHQPCRVHPDAGVQVDMRWLFCQPCGYRTQLPNTWILR